MTTGRRWYLLAFDRDRQDWRSLRLDRMADVRALGSTFVAREAPDAADYVRRAISASPYRYVARIRFAASEEVAAHNISRTPRRSSRPTARTPASSPPAPTIPSGWRCTSRWWASTSRCWSRRRWSRRRWWCRPACVAPPEESDDAQPLDQEQEGRRERAVGGGGAHTVPVDLLTDRTHRGQQDAKSQWCSVSELSFSVSTWVGGSTRHPDREHVEFLGRLDGRRCSTGTPLSACSTSMTKSLPTQALNNQSSGVRSIRNPAFSSVDAAASVSGSATTKSTSWTGSGPPYTHSA